MRRRSEDYDEEAARREPLLRRRSPQPPAADGGGAAAFSRGPSPDRADDGHHSHRTPGTFRLTKRTSTAAQVGAGWRARAGGPLPGPARSVHRQRAAAACRSYPTAHPSPPLLLAGG